VPDILSFTPLNSVPTHGYYDASSWLHKGGGGDSSESCAPYNIFEGQSHHGHYRYLAYLSR
jgi:hypothetical protein